MVLIYRTVHKSLPSEVNHCQVMASDLRLCLRPVQLTIQAEQASQKPPSRASHLFTLLLQWLARVTTSHIKKCLGHRAQLPYLSLQLMFYICYQLDSGFLTQLDPGFLTQLVSDFKISCHLTPWLSLFPHQILGLTSWLSDLVHTWIIFTAPDPGWHLVPWVAPDLSAYNPVWKW